MDLETNEVLDNQVTEPEVEQINQEVTENTEGTTTQNDVVPLKTHLETKKQMKDLKRELAKLKETQYTNESLAYRDKVEKKYIEAGYEESLAKMIAEDLANVRDLATTKKQSYIEDSIDEDIQDLAGTDEYYSDAIDYANSIKAKIEDFKKKGVELDVADAYALVVNPRQKARRNNDLDSQREILNNKKSGVTGGTNVPTASSSKPTTQYKLDADDKKALANLQRMQPGANWTPEKYYKLMK